MPVNKRLEREKRTVEAMIGIFCQQLHRRQSRHPGHELCPACQELQDYALRRVSACKFREDKPTCAQCSVHCYKPEMRERIRTVMRYSGPRMLFKHPGMAIRHVLEGKRTTAGGNGTRH